jgi:malate synthase
MPHLELLEPDSGAPGKQTLSPAALQLVADLHAEFGDERLALLRRRDERQADLDAGGTLTFATVGEDEAPRDWQVAPAPADLADRRVEITGPAERKMIINALNSGASGFMACFEDALSPTWDNVVDGHAAIAAAARGTLTHTTPEGRRYALGEEPATLHVRPRGWHLDELHVRADERPVAAAFFDAGVFLAGSAAALLERGRGPYLYLPKLESHLEARLWNRVLAFAEERLGLPHASVRVTVLIETLPAAFEMDRILFELRDRICALNAGRWDYIFSAIKCFRERADMILADRAEVTMTVPFMRAYTELLVQTCHRRGAHAMGGMAALIPSRDDPATTERALDAVRADKRREAGAGFDGTWIAHPALVDVARAEFDAVLGEAPNQVGRRRDDVAVTADDLLALTIPGARVTEAGLRNNLAVGVQYVESWLRGTGAVAINGLMEDAATAEIARSQIWQWVRHGVDVEGIGRLDEQAVRRLLADEVTKLGSDGRLEDAAALLASVALGHPMASFLTLPAYDQLLAEGG